jgi:hypothetical protein
MFRHYEIDSRMNAEIEEVLPDGVRLKGGEVLPSAFTMVMPRFLGVDAVRNTPGLANANGFIEVADSRAPRRTGQSWRSRSTFSGRGVTRTCELLLRLHLGDEGARLANHLVGDAHVAAIRVVHEPVRHA